MIAEIATETNAPGVTTVLHVVNTLEGGGMERMLLALLDRFQEPSLGHVVVTLREAGSLASRLPNDVPCFSINGLRRSLSTPLKLVRLIRSHVPAIVHARGIGCWFDGAAAVALARFGRTPTPLLLGFHGWEQSKPFTAKHRLVARMGRVLGARFLSVSYSGADLLHRKLAIPRAQIHVLPNGADLGRFSGHPEALRSKTRTALHIPPDAFVITMVGSLTAVKCHRLLIAAAQQLPAAIPNLRILFVGDGPLRDALKDQSSSSELDSVIRFLGRREDIPAVLAASDVYVCASASEGMSNAVLEALAAGLPVIATAVGDNPRLLHDRIDGVLIQPGSSTALAEAIRALAADGALRQRLGAAARLRAAEFDLDSCVRRYQGLYGSLTAKRLGGHNSDAVARQRNLGSAACDIETNARSHLLHQTGVHAV